MAKHELKPAKKVLIFSQTMKLIAVARSVRAAADLLAEGSGKCSAANVSQAANGKQTKANGYYIRTDDPKVEIEISDIGELDLREYDKLCGVSRLYKRKKYKKRIKKTEDADSDSK